MEITSNQQWVIKGEGNANVVFQYTGGDGQFINRVLRLRKQRANNIPTTPESQRLECEVWSQLVATCNSSNQQLDDGYIDMYLAPFLGRQFIPSKEPVLISTAVAKQLLGPSRQLDVHTNIVKNTKEDSCLTAALMKDVTQLNQPCSLYASDKEQLQGEEEEPCICIEIKPKCGFIQNCETIHPKNEQIKKSSSRYQLHQQLKVQEEQENVVSGYDPLDLFSGDKERMKKAINALCRNPQNNFVLFRNGQRVPLSPPTSIGSPNGVLMQEEELGGCNGADAIEILITILETEGVLERLLAAQKLCPYDIEGIYALYTHLLHQNNTIPIETHSDDAAHPHQQAINKLLNLPREEALAVLRDFAVSTTAKDCSIMTTFRRMNANVVDYNTMNTMTSNTAAEKRGAYTFANKKKQECVEGGYGCIQCETSGQWYEYCIAFADLDLKPLAKIPQYYELDTRIIECALKNIV